jgi:L-asparaginase
MPSTASRIVVLGTGGTIAGTSADAADSVGYTAAQLGVAQLLAAVPDGSGLLWEAEQVAQLDSKDMDFATWQRLAQRCDHHLARDDVAGVVVTHGTDTLDETAYFLHRVLSPTKPLVLTAAMRPATAVDADGPHNLLDALRVAQQHGAQGVSVVMAGSVFHPVGLRKRHTFRPDAFDAGDAGPIARIESGHLRRFREWPAGVALGLDMIAAPPADWPLVDIVLNHVGADGRIVDALVARGLHGLVVAGTGNATVSQALAQALERAMAAGVAVRLASRCAAGAVRPAGRSLPDDDAELTAPQARVALLLQVLAERRAA